MKFNNNWILILILAGLTTAVTYKFVDTYSKPDIELPKNEQTSWTAPSLYIDQSLEGEERKLVIYGEALIANTSKYLGPNGSVAHITNGMNCQNCHLNAGKKTWGNNYGAVASTYPKFRDRSGSIETIYKRVSDCMERSLNGSTLDSNAKEMKAMIAYIKWVGHEVQKDSVPKGSGIKPPEYLERAANPSNGKVVYQNKCQSCHGSNGGGLMAADAMSYTYPPLWGKNSYNIGAGLYRLSRFAGYVRDNMPFNQSTHNNPILSDEECWDVAAFVNSQPRPTKDLSSDWPNISKKPVDHPFGPYTDGFSETQHKFGPFKPIIEGRKKQQANKIKS